jgi:TonB family protein
MSVCAQQTNPNNLQTCPKDSKNIGNWHKCWGSYLHPSGAQYYGEFENGAFEGLGIYVYNLGDIYIGQFKRGNLHGQGLFISGTLRREGVWEFNKFIHPQKINLSYVKSFIDGFEPFGKMTRDMNVQRIKELAANELSSEQEESGERKNLQKSFADKIAERVARNIRFRGEDNSVSLDPTTRYELSLLPDGSVKNIKILQSSGSRAFDEAVIRAVYSTAPFERNPDTAIVPDSILVTQRMTIESLRPGAHEIIDEGQIIELNGFGREKQLTKRQVNLQISYTQPSEDGSLKIEIKTNVDTVSLKVNGEEQGGKAGGDYVVKKFARIGQDTKFTITAIDINGNSDTKTFTVARQSALATDTFIPLKPEVIKRASARDAVAIIIGIQDYKRVPKAEFANNDAKEFYEYAIRALGIKPEKIKMLLDDEADEVNIVKAFENWLPIQVNKDKTDIYVFFSGHGLPAPDGKSLYFLPHGVDKELLSRTAVSQNDIVNALSNAKPKSVTMFIDACYSGQSRVGDVLVANAKPVSLKSDANSYPPNFTVITASANDQISSSSPELKHGIFSFYLMKGMEGEADANRDGKITVGEMQDYLSDKVSRQAMTLNRKQTTQLVGDAGQVLVGK